MAPEASDNAAKLAGGNRSHVCGVIRGYSFLCDDTICFSCKSLRILYQFHHLYWRKNFWIDNRFLFQTGDRAFRGKSSEIWVFIPLIFTIVAVIADKFVTAAIEVALSDQMLTCNQVWHVFNYGIFHHQMAFGTDRHDATEIHPLFAYGLIIVDIVSATGACVLLASIPLGRRQDT